MDFTKLNEIAKGSSGLSFLPTKRMCDLEKGKNYMITSLKHCKTRYGKKIIVTINESFQVFLPDRVGKNIDESLFNELTEKTNKMLLFINYYGENKFEFECI